MTLAELRDELENLTSCLPSSTQCGILYRGDVHIITSFVPARIPDEGIPARPESMLFTAVVGS